MKKFDMEPVPLFDADEPEPPYLVRSSIKFEGIIYEHTESFTAWQWEGFPDDLKKQIMDSSKENLSKIIARHAATVTVTREA